MEAGSSGGRHTDEVSRADVDRGGYDLIAELGGCLRHIQIKGSVCGSATARQKVHVALADKPSGCVVWVYLNEEDWNLGPFLYFGGDPGTPMPPLGDKVARHTKGDATGEKKERPNIREINKGRFRKLETIDEVWGGVVRQRVKRRREKTMKGIEIAIRPTTRGRLTSRQDALPVGIGRQT